MRGLIGPTRVIRENDDLPVPRCGVDRTAHAKGPIPDSTIGLSVLHFVNTQTLFHPWRGLKYSFWYSFWRGFVTGGVLKITEFYSRSRRVAPPLCHRTGRPL